MRCGRCGKEIETCEVCASVARVLGRSIAPCEEPWCIDCGEESP